MTRKIPNNVKEEIYNEFVKRAVVSGYGNLNRPESGQFIDSLVADPLIGGKVGEFLKKDRVRTYIKDSLLNRYTKNLNDLPRDITEYIKEAFNIIALEIDYKKEDRVSLHRFEDKTNHFLIAARGTFIKWETALRKALNYIVCSPAANTNGAEVKILLLISANNKSITEPDKETLRRALLILRVFVIFLK